jgi:formyltetrahydrofolate-dependent phosphoribosylglycinamide formyltransferase
MAVRIAVLASGGGTNLQALLDALRSDDPARVARVVSDRAGAGALRRAEQAGIATAVLRDATDPAELEAALDHAELVVLAGYLRLVPPAVVARFPWRVINIHPALLPAFGGPGMYGRRVHEAVLASGARVTGATVHYADEAYDRGPIIAQWPVPVLAGDDAAALAARVLQVEHALLPQVVLALAGLGLPDRPLRLSARGGTFRAAAAGAVDVKLDRRTA